MQNYKLQEKTNLTTLGINLKTLIIVIGFVFALLPTIHNFIPNEVEYNLEKEQITLNEGTNEIGDVIVLVKNGKVINIEKINKSVSNRIFGFINFRKFIAVTSPYFSLSFITVFLGYILLRIKDKHLQNVGKIIFYFYTFTSIFFLLWVFLPNNDLDQTLYKVYLALGALLLASFVFFSYKYLTTKQSKLSRLMNYVLFSRSETIYPLAKEDDTVKKYHLVKKNDEKLEETLKEIL